MNRKQLKELLEANEYRQQRLAAEEARRAAFPDTRSARYRKKERQPQASLVRPNFDEAYAKWKRDRESRDERLRSAYADWRAGRKEAGEIIPEKHIIPQTIKPSDRPFCVFGANGETTAKLGPFPGCVAIYALIDPRDSTVRYVGKTTSPRFRLAEHIENTGEDCRRRRWIAELKAMGMVPHMEILDRVSARRWEAVERRWIAFYANRGALLNVEIGGKGYLHEYLAEQARLTAGPKPATIPAIPMNCAVAKPTASGAYQGGIKVLTPRASVTGKDRHGHAHITPRVVLGGT